MLRQKVRRTKKDGERAWSEGVSEERGRGKSRQGGKQITEIEEGQGEKKGREGEREGGLRRDMAEQTQKGNVER